MLMKRKDIIEMQGCGKEETSDRDECLRGSSGNASCGVWGRAEPEALDPRPWASQLWQTLLELLGRLVLSLKELGVNEERRWLWVKAGQGTAQYDPYPLNKYYINNHHDDVI